MTIYDQTRSKEQKMKESTTKQERGRLVRSEGTTWSSKTSRSLVGSNKSTLLRHRSRRRRRRRTLVSEGWEGWLDRTGGPRRRWSWAIPRDHVHVHAHVRVHLYWTRAGRAGSRHVDVRCRCTIGLAISSEESDVGVVRRGVWHRLISGQNVGRGRCGPPLERRRRRSALELARTGLGEGPDRSDLLLGRRRSVRGRVPLDEFGGRTRWSLGLRLPCMLRLSTLLDRVSHEARRSGSWERRDGGLWKGYDRRGKGSVGPSAGLLERFRFRLHHRVQNLGAVLAGR